MKRKGASATGISSGPETPRRQPVLDPVPENGSTVPTVMVEASQTPIQLIQIHPEDNIGLLPCTVEAGSSVSIDRTGYPVAETLSLGHKIALRPIAKGESVIKYGVSIGSATMDIPTGTHVHVHNMKSDYIPTFTLEEGKRFTR